MPPYFPHTNVCKLTGPVCHYSSSSLKGPVRHHVKPSIVYRFPFSRVKKRARLKALCATITEISESPRSGRQSCGVPPPGRTRAEPLRATVQEGRHICHHVWPCVPRFSGHLCLVAWPCVPPVRPCEPPISDLIQLFTHILNVGCTYSFIHDYPQALF